MEINRNLTVAQAEIIQLFHTDPDFIATLRHAAAEDGGTILYDHQRFRLYHGEHEMAKWWFLWVTWDPGVVTRPAQVMNDVIYTDDEIQELIKFGTAPQQ